MTTKASFNLNGMAKYLEDIVQAGVDIDPAADRALQAGADVLLPEMQRLVPVGDSAEGDEHPGNLKRNIVIEGPTQAGNLHTIEIGVLDADAETAIYGNVQEYGSPSKHIVAQPYIRPAIDGKKAAVKKAIKQSLVNEGFVNP
jgi:HK97 gp10 family phage protein